MTVAARFQALLAKTSVSDRERSDYTALKNGVRQALATEYPGSKCEAIGSHARGSAVGITSDLDLLVS